MAVDPRLLMSAKFAEHLWLTSVSDGITYFYVNKKGKNSPGATLTGGGMKMGASEQRHVKTILDVVSRNTDLLNFKETKKAKYSSWEIKKVGGFGGEPSLQGIALSPSWGWEIYFKDEGGMNLTRFEYQLMTHEIGHSLGLSHPGENPTNPAYSQADTVMSYNVVVDNNGNVVPYGITSSDASAILNWWNTSGFVKQEFNKPESVGDFKVIQADEDKDHSHNHFEISKPKMPVYKLEKSGKIIDFEEVWGEESDKISSLLERKSNGSSPLIVKLTSSDDSIDVSDWSGSGLKDGVSVGHLLIKGMGGDDEFILRGNKLFGNNIYAKDLVISGGKGLDTVVLDDAFDFPNAKAGMLAGNKVIRFFGKSEQVEILDGAKVINADKQQGVIIREDVEQVQVNGDILSFSELYDAVQAL